MLGIKRQSDRPAEELAIEIDRQAARRYGVSPDSSPIIGFTPGARAWIDACGFSGHGIMHAPATGIAVSELIADGAAHTVDVAAFRHGRFGEDVAVEANVF